MSQVVEDKTTNQTFNKTKIQMFDSNSKGDN